jgi:hypothetical protein
MRLFAAFEPFGISNVVVEGKPARGAVTQLTSRVSKPIHLLAGIAGRCVSKGRKQHRSDWGIFWGMFREEYRSHPGNYTVAGLGAELRS